MYDDALRETDPLQVAQGPVQRSVVPAGDWLRELAREAGADDIGLVALARPELDTDRKSIEEVAPWTETLVAFVCRMNREPIRSPARSLANLEFHHTGDTVNRVARRIVARLEELGHRAVNPSMGFPMEMDRFPGKIWAISHKIAAEAAGLGKMGIHRNVIHPRFGSFVLLGTVLTDAVVEEDDPPIDYDPCVSCKLCVAACPVGAIGADGHFNFSACYTHNYREFMGGFSDWVENVAESKSRFEYRARVSDSESASMWQSLSFGANYKAAYCVAVCPAGDDVMPPFREDRARFVRETVRPLQQKEEVVYVLPGSDAEEHVASRFPSKTVKHVGNSLHPRTIDDFLDQLPLLFNPGRAAGLDATYHFVFSGREEILATIIISGGAVHVQRGHCGNADLRVRADSETWLGFLAGERSLPRALITFKIRLWGNPKLLVAFGRCFAV